MESNNLFSLEMMLEKLNAKKQELLARIKLRQSNHKKNKRMIQGEHSALATLTREIVLTQLKISEIKQDYKSYIELTKVINSLKHMDFYNETSADKEIFNKVVVDFFELSEKDRTKVLKKISNRDMSTLTHLMLESEVKERYMNNLIKIDLLKLKEVFDHLQPNDKEVVLKNLQEDHNLERIYYLNGSLGDSLNN